MYDFTTCTYYISIENIQCKYNEHMKAVLKKEIKILNKATGENVRNKRT